MKSIKIILDKVILSTPTSYTEVNFKSRSGFSAGCFYNNGKWTTFLKLEKYDEKSYIFMDKDDFSKLVEILIKAKTTIN